MRLLLISLFFSLVNYSFSQAACKGISRDSCVCGPYFLESNEYKVYLSFGKNGRYDIIVQNIFAKGMLEGSMYGGTWQQKGNTVYLTSTEQPFKGGRVKFLLEDREIRFKPAPRWKPYFRGGPKVFSSDGKGC